LTSPPPIILAVEIVRVLADLALEGTRLEAEGSSGLEGWRP
jgi:hypothetical protein